MHAGYYVFHLSHAAVAGAQINSRKNYKLCSVALNVVMQVCPCSNIISSKEALLQKAMVVQMVDLWY